MHLDPSAGPVPPGLRPPAAVLGLLLLATLLVAAPVLAAGFFADDWLQLDMVASTGPWCAYQFQPDAAAFPAALSRGRAPWWGDPGIRTRLCRPLASGLLALEREAFGLTPWPFHLTTLLLYLAVVGAAGALLLGLFRPRLALLATAIYALDGRHSLNIAWIANRHASLSIALGLCALLLHRDAREAREPGSGRPRGRWWAAPLLLVLSLAAGETGLECLGLLLAYELLAGPPGRARTMSLAGLLGLGAGYLAFHHAGGYGISGLELYLDPRADPRGCLLGLAARLPALGGELFLYAPVDLWSFADATKPWLVLAGLLALPLAGWALAPALAGLTPVERRNLAWLAAGCGLALVPAALAPPSARNLLLPSLASDLAVAVVILHGGRAALGRFLSGLHLAVSPLALCLWLAGFAAFGRWGEGLVPLDDLAARTAAGQRVHVLAGPPLRLSITPLLLDLYRVGRHASWDALGFGAGAYRLERPDARTLVLTRQDRSLPGSDFERMPRAARAPLPAGATVRANGFQATVLEVGPGGPVRVRFVFERPLEDPGYLFMESAAGPLRPARLPPVGGTRDLPAPAAW